MWRPSSTSCGPGWRLAPGSSRDHGDSQMDSHSQQTPLSPRRRMRLTARRQPRLNAPQPRESPPKAEAAPPLRVGRIGPKRPSLTAAAFALSSAVVWCRLVQGGRVLGATIVLLASTSGGCTQAATRSGMTRVGLPASGGEHVGTASVAPTCGGAYDPERGSNFASCGARRIRYYPRGGHR